MGITFIAYLAFAGAVSTATVAETPVIEPSQTTSPLPESYFTDVMVDMRDAPPGSGTTATGAPRNGPWFWEQVYGKHPEYFSPENVARIQGSRPRSPIIDQQWVNYHPQHMSYMGNKLVHHHIAQGSMAVGIPEPIHWSWYSFLHTNQGGK
jgi:hypothetical protein